MFAALFVAVSVLVGGVLIYAFKGQNINNQPAENNPSQNGTIPEGQQSVVIEGDGRSPEFKVEFEGKTLTANRDFQIGILDGVADKAPDVATQTIFLRADVKKIYPDATIESKVFSISARGIEVLSVDNNGNITPDKIENIKENTSISVGLVESQTNRDILTKEDFKASKITFFRD